MGSGCGIYSEKSWEMWNGCWMHRCILSMCSSALSLNAGPSAMLTLKCTVFAGMNYSSIAFMLKILMFKYEYGFICTNYSVA